MGAWFDVIVYHCDDILSVSFKSSNKPHAEYPENPYQRLRVLTELYKFVTEITNDCLWEWDVHHKEIFWIDGGHKRVFGYPIENALVPQYFWESCIHPEDKKRVLDKLSRTIAEGVTDTWEDEYRFKKANGEYAYVCDRGHIVYQDGVALRIIGATQDNTEKVLLENKLSAQRETNLVVITNAAFTAQENEKAIIGTELHDNVNQVLAIIKMNLQMAKTANSKKEHYLDKSVELINTVIKDIRRLTRGLVIPGIEFTGLTDNVKNLIADLSEGNPCTIAFYTKDIQDSAISEKLQVNIFRIIQEQLINILNYKKTACIDLALYKNEETEDTIVLLVSDNEDSSDHNNLKKETGSINILSRAQLCNGTVSTVSTPGEGYLLKITFPISAQC
jgi:signal transduction histidine kinase